MPSDRIPRDPLVIGATGGSGTRVMAKICQDIGFDLGDRLNRSLDALDFVPFLDRWIDPCLSHRRDPAVHIDVAEMGHQLDEVLEAHLRNTRSTGPRWGWKNPRTLLILPYLDRLLPAMRFIHMVRDGRDMAYSTNQNQVRKHLESLLGPGLMASPAELSLRFWGESNLSGIDYGERIMSGRYMLVRFEDLCSDPARTINDVLKFLDVDSHVDAEKLARNVIPPESLGRWKSHQHEEQMLLSDVGKQYLARFGYAV